MIDIIIYLSTNRNW